MYSTAGDPIEIVPYHLWYPSSESGASAAARRVRALSLKDDGGTPEWRSNAVIPLKYFLVVTGQKERYGN